MSEQQQQTQQQQQQGQQDSQDLQNLNINYMETRAHFIQRNLRCLDCDEITYSIEHVDSPIAIEQKKLIRFLLRKGFSDLQIYEELGNVYGQHSIFKMKLMDDKLTNSQMENSFLVQPFLYGLSGLSLFGVFKLAKKFMKK